MCGTFFQLTLDHSGNYRRRRNGESDGTLQAASMRLWTAVKEHLRSERTAGDLLRRFNLLRRTQPAYVIQMAHQQLAGRSEEDIRSIKKDLEHMFVSQFHSLASMRIN